MDIALCIYEPETKTLNYSGANNPCWVIREGKELIELEADKNPVSIYFRMQSFTTKTIQLKDNDCVYLFTDGFHDQFGGDQNKKFQKKNLKKLILENNQESLDLQYKLLEKSIETWKVYNPQVDDITILGIRV